MFAVVTITMIEVLRVSGSAALKIWLLMSPDIDVVCEVADLLEGAATMMPHDGDIKHHMHDLWDHHAIKPQGLLVFCFSERDLRQHPYSDVASGCRHGVCAKESDMIVGAIPTEGRGHRHGVVFGGRVSP